MATSASGVQAFPCELREVHIVERVDDSDGPPGVGGRETTSVLEIFVMRDVQPPLAATQIMSASQNEILCSSQS